MVIWLLREWKFIARSHIILDIEKLFDADMQNIWFQQDGAELHYVT